MIIRSLFSSVLILTALALAGCDESLSTLAGPTPNLEPTFSSIQRDIFEATDAAGRAACVNCHTDAGGRTPQSGLNLRHEVAYANLVGITSRGKPQLQRVAPGEPDNSYLVHKVEGGPDITGQRMPRTGGPYLTEGQVLILRRWIALGAPNN
jgi:hypothetical protein